MRVVTDSGPLTHLWQIGQWEAFRTFDAIHVPAQVAHEVERHVPLVQMKALAGRAVSVDEVSEQEIAAARQAAPANLILHQADLATLALARRQPPDLVLTDDLAMRQAIEAQGQTQMGSVGILSPQFKAYVRRLIATMATGRLP